MTGFLVTLLGVMLAQTPTQPQQTPQTAAEEKTTIGDTMISAPGARVDHQFVREAFISSMLDVELGKVAMQKGATEGVKQMGKTMVSDHLKQRVEFNRVAVTEKINVPSALDPKRQARVERLEKLSGMEFDRAYVKDQLKEHEGKVKIFKDEAINGTDEGLRGLAAKYLPEVEQHLNSIRELNKTLAATASK